MGFRGCSLTVLIGSAVLVSGCGQSGGAWTVPHNAPVPQNAMTLAKVHQASKSWMKADASGSDLLYVALRYDNEVDAFSFPGGQLVGKLTGLSNPSALCSDSRGNIWVAEDHEYSSFTMLEYAHAGTSPIATVSGSNGAAEGCSVDARTENLAVATDYYYRQGYVDVFKGGQGTPTVYYPDIWFPNSITYDKRGDLFVAGTLHVYSAGTDWLPKGGSAMSDFKLNPHTYPHTGIAWDGHYLVEIAHPNLIHRYVIKPKHGKGVPAFTLDVPSIFAFTIYTSTLVASDYLSNVYFFAYPEGGAPTTTLSDLDGPTGVAVSGAPSPRSRATRRTR